MSAANVELVRGFYAVLNAGDLDLMMSLCDDDVEFVNPAEAAETGTRAGANAFRGAFERLLSDFTDFHSGVVEITSMGDDVAVVTQSTGRGRASGVPFSEEIGHLFSLRAGRITRFRWFQTVDELRRAPGPSP